MKTKIFLLIFLSLFFTTHNAAAFSHNSSQSKNVVIAKKLFEYFNKHDWEEMAGLYADPAEFLDPAFGQQAVKRTRRQTIQKHKEMQDMSKDIRDDVVQVFPSGDNTVIVEFVSSGTGSDGTKWTLPLCIIFTIENGQITKDHTYYDNPSEK